MFFFFEGTGGACALEVNLFKVTKNYNQENAGASPKKRS